MNIDIGRPPTINGTTGAILTSVDGTEAIVDTRPKEAAADYKDAVEVRDGIIDELVRWYGSKGAQLAMRLEPGGEA
jgi:hypothetical protein